MKRSLLAAAAALSATPAFAASSSSSGGDPIMGLLGIAVILACYFFPSIIAVCRGHHNTLAIFLLNLFLGWTGLGWLGSLIWSATAVVRRNADGQIG
jgi:T4 superinfection immunity protein